MSKFEISGSKDIGIRRSKFVKRTLFLYFVKTATNVACLIMVVKRNNSDNKTNPSFLGNLVQRFGSFIL